jgi:tetratricopeptide (TPR) repeat protein
MKRAAMFMLVLALGTLMFAQQQTGTQGQTAAPAGAQSGTTPQPTTPGAKRPPQAKTQPEFEAFKAANGLQDAAARDKAADDFAAKYPDSELRILLFKQAMRDYQNANNADKMQEMGRKVLAIDPDDPEALVGVAEILTERTRDTDLDKDQRLAEAMKLAQHALETIDTDVAVPAGTPQDKIDAYKGFLRSSAYSVLGTLALNSDKYPQAEDYLRKSIAALPQQPDPLVVLRLALALDKQDKYPDALKEANHAVELTQDSTPAGKLARQEKDRLEKLTGGANKPPTQGQGAAAPKQ